MQDLTPNTLGGRIKCQVIRLAAEQLGSPALASANREAKLLTSQMFATSKGRKMLNLGKKIADQIDYSNSTLRYQMWLDQEVNDLALSISGLDSFPSQAILPLVKIAANGEANCRRLALRLGMEETTVDGYLQSLCEFKFVKETGNGYTVTPLGEQAFKAIGMRMVIRERGELKRRLEQIEKLHEQLKNF